MSFKKKTKPNKPENNQTRDSFESLYELFERREKVLNAFKSVIFSVLQIEGTKHLSDLALHLKMSTLKQKLKRLPVALAQVKACNTFENLLYEIWKIKYSLYWSNKIFKKVCNNIIYSIKVFLNLFNKFNKYKMSTAFINSKKSKKILKSCTKTINLKYQLQCEMINSA